MGELKPAADVAREWLSDECFELGPNEAACIESLTDLIEARDKAVREAERAACATLVEGHWGDTNRPFRRELSNKIRVRSSHV